MTWGVSAKTKVQLWVRCPCCSNRFRDVHAWSNFRDSTLLVELVGRKKILDQMISPSYYLTTKLHVGSAQLVLCTFSYVRASGQTVLAAPAVSTKTYVCTLCVSKFRGVCCCKRHHEPKHHFFSYKKIANTYREGHERFPTRIHEFS